jgi:hypothetical protein
MGTIIRKVNMSMEKICFFIAPIGETDSGKSNIEGIKNNFSAVSNLKSGTHITFPLTTFFLHTCRSYL